MKIVRSTKESILPEAVEVLYQNQSAKMYFSDYKPPIKQPGGLYNTSLRKVFDKFERLLDELETMLSQAPFRNQKDYGSNFDTPLLDAQESLLLTLKSHFDTCEDVLRCFYQKSVGEKLKIRKQSEYETFFNAIKQDFFAHVKDIANYLKHDTGTLKFLALFSDKIAIVGYYASYADESGIVRPRRDFHKPVYSKLEPKFGYETAFSFFRDIRFLFWGVFFVSHHLANAINTKCGTNATGVYPKKGRLDETVLRISQRISALPTHFFSDEMHPDKAIPSVKLSVINGATELSVAYPDSMALLTGVDEIKHQVLISHLSDGYTTQYMRLYFKCQLD